MRKPTLDRETETVFSCSARRVVGLAVCALTLMACADHARAPAEANSGSPLETSAAPAVPAGAAAPEVVPPPAPDPRLFLIDSAHELRSFDVDGKLLRRANWNSRSFELNGGITAAMRKLYVTYADASGKGTGVLAFNRSTLKLVALHEGAFTVPAGTVDPGVYHAIVYDERRAEFYVGTDRGGVLAFDRFGTYLPRLARRKASVSSLALDSAHQSLWAVVDRREIVRVDEASGDFSIGVPTSASKYEHALGPVAAVECATDADADTPAVLDAAFAPRVEGRRKGAALVRRYQLNGKPSGAPFGKNLAGPHALACGARGSLWVGADNGLYQYSSQGLEMPLSEDFQNASAPILGMLVLPP